MLLWLCILWVLASVVVALLPMQRQYLPGFLLLCVAPVLIFQIGQVVGIWASVAGLAAFLSMYRNPLRYFWKRLRGKKVELPQ